MPRAAVGAAIAATALLGSPAAFAQPSSSSPRVLDAWSGSTFLCEVDAKLKAPGGLCDGVNAEAARQATAAKIKLVALVSGDGESGKTAKARAAGFEENSAVEMHLQLRPPHSPLGDAIIDVNALSRLDPVPQQVAGQPHMFRKIYAQGADLDAAPDWARKVVPTVKTMLEGFFETYSAPAQER